MKALLKPALLLIGASALLALMYFWWISENEKHWFDRQIPVEGEASYNDYYVIQQALRAQGVKVLSLPNLPAGIEGWSADDALLLGSDLKTLNPGQVDALLDWVGRGGRLIVATHADQPSDAPALLERIGVVAWDGDRTFPVDCTGWKKDEKATSTLCLGTFGLQPAERASFQVAVGDEKKGWMLARRNWGLGQIEVIGNLFPLQNRSMDGPENADWAWQVLAPMLQGGLLHIVYQTELPPLYVYLVRYGWYALLPLLVALLAWLWARSQRFGPAMSLPAPDRRALGEHIQASGEFLYRRGLVPALYAPLRRRFDEQLRRRDPELASLPAPDIARTLAQRLKLPIEAVQQALHPPAPGQRKLFLSTVQTLLRMIRTL